MNGIQMYPLVFYGLDSRRSGEPGLPKDGYLQLRVPSSFASA
jgi:hypothetical protein